MSPLTSETPSKHDTNTPTWYNHELNNFIFPPFVFHHAHAFNVHSSNTKNMAMKQLHVVEISKKQLARLISDKHLLAFLLNLGIKGFLYTCDKFNL
jgi:hypothetical protein